MNFKSLMLGAAAAAAATGAQAADLPVAPEPVDYVRVCDAHGTGFFYIPGTETCLRIGGRVRVEARAFDSLRDGGSAWDARSDISTGFRARGYMRFDSRTNTEYGLLRTYVETFITNDTGGTDGLALDKAFIQFGGFTAGRAGSFYDFYTGANWGSVLNMGFADNGSINLFAYTAAFGNGFSATLSVEDGMDRRAGIARLSTAAAVAPVVATGSLNGLATTRTTGSTVTTNFYGGHKIPDLVANLRVDQGWGSAQIMGALHHVYVNGSSRNIDSKMGYAIGAGVRFNLPMISSGTQIGFQAAYSNGAANYAAAGNGTYRDAIVDATGTAMKLTKAWTVGAGISQAWTSTLSSGLTASYINYDHGYNVQDLSELNIQGNLVWSPVSGLDIGAELEYSNQNYNNAAGTTFTDADSLVGVFRVQRTF